MFTLSAENTFKQADLEFRKAPLQKEKKFWILVPYLSNRLYLI